MKYTQFFKHNTFYFIKRIFKSLPSFDKRLRSRTKDFKKDTSPVAVVVLDNITMKHKVFHSISKAAVYLNSYPKAISRKLHSKQLYVNRYFITTKKEWDFFIRFSQALILIVYTFIFIYLANFINLYADSIITLCENFYNELIHFPYENLLELFDSKNKHPNNSNIEPIFTEIFSTKHIDHVKAHVTENQFSFKSYYQTNSIIDTKDRYHFLFRNFNYNLNKKSILDLVNFNFHSILNIANLDFHSMLNPQNVITNQSPITPITEILGFYSDKNRYLV